MKKIRKLIDDYVNYYELFGKESKKTILKRVLEEIDRICIEDDWTYFTAPNSETGFDGIFYIMLGGRYSENREYCQLKCFEEIAKKIKERFEVDDDELLELFESSMNINKDNYKERFCTYTEKFTVPCISQSEVGILMKLFCIKEIESSTEKYSNPYWETLLENMMTLGYLKISNLGLSDEFKEKYLPEYYKKIDKESFLRGEDDIELLLKYIDNPTIKGYLYTIKEQLSEEQFSSLKDKTKLSEIYMVFNGKKKDDDFYNKLLHEKLKELYPEDITSEIINLLIKLPMKFKEKLSIIIEDKDTIMELIKNINILSLLFDNNIEDSFKIVIYYPELMKSIDSFENINEKNIELLKKLAKMPKLNNSPNSINELEEILSNPVISTVERQNDRFQPDDSELGGGFDGYRSIIVIDKNGMIKKLSNLDHYKLVSYMYGLPGKQDYFHDLIEKSNEGYITIITEGSSAFIYFPSKISKEQFEGINKVFDKYGIDDMNSDFWMIQAKDKSEGNIEENYVTFEGKDNELLRKSNVIGILRECIEQTKIEQKEEKRDEDIETDR